MPSDKRPQRVTLDPSHKIEFYNEKGAPPSITSGGRRRSSSKKRRAKRRRAIRNRIIGIILLIGIIATIVLLIRSFMGEGKIFGSGRVERGSGGTSSTVEEAPAATGYEASPYFEAAIPLLCNAWTPLPDGYTVETASVGDRDGGAEQFMQKNAAAAFLAMQAAAEKEGIRFSPYSGYRSHDRQVANYNSSIQNYLNQGFSQEEAEQKTRAYYAVPGTSEHEAGLAIDINGTEESFERTDAFAWLQENCADYGFILRYERDTFDITGIAYEPWHYRYVGINHAHAIKEQGVTLEEYVEQLTRG